MEKVYVCNVLCAVLRLYLWMTEAAACSQVSLYIKLTVDILGFTQIISDCYIKGEQLNNMNL